MFRYLKWRQFNLEARSKLLRMMVKKGWKGMDLPENFATCLTCEMVKVGSFILRGR